jgi:hypothetical protein
VAQDTASRTITAAEVRDWFGKSPESRLGNAQYCDIAAYLTRLKWPSDPMRRPSSRRSADETIESDAYWDFKAATDAAKLLRESIPAMLTHWNGLLWAPETRGGYAAIKTFQDALVITLPYIEWPFGEYERQTGRKQPKTWQLPAVLIAKVIMKAMIEAGHNEPGITRNSIVVRVIRKALIRMRFLNEITISAVGAHLTRWDKKYGLTPKGIATLTTK